MCVCVCVYVCVCVCVCVYVCVCFVGWLFYVSINFFLSYSIWGHNWNHPTVGFYLSLLGCKSLTSTSFFSIVNHNADMQYLAYIWLIVNYKKCNKGISMIKLPLFLMNKGTLKMYIYLEVFSLASQLSSLSLMFTISSIYVLMLATRLFLWCQRVD